MIERFKRRMKNWLRNKRNMKKLWKKKRSKLADVYQGTLRILQRNSFWDDTSWRENEKDSRGIWGTEGWIAQKMGGAEEEDEWTVRAVEEDVADVCVELDHWDKLDESIELFEICKQGSDQVLLQSAEFSEWWLLLRISIFNCRSIISQVIFRMKIPSTFIARKQLLFRNWNHW